MKIKAFVSGHLKLFKIISAVIAFAMIAGLVLFASSLLGNPFSYYKVKNHAQKYVAENYAAEGYVLDSVAYIFKNGDYIAHVEKPGSLDYRFTLIYGNNGKLRFDSNDNSTSIDLNVYSRIDASYRELVKTVVESTAYPYSSDIAHGSIAVEGFRSKHEKALPRSVLVPDALFDIRRFGEEAGYLTIYVDTKELTAENAAEILLTIDSLMEQGGVPFYAIDLVLEDRDLEPRDRYLSIYEFPRSEIYEDGLVERVKLCIEKTTQNMAKLEAEKYS